MHFTSAKSSPEILFVLINLFSLHKGFLTNATHHQRFINLSMKCENFVFWFLERREYPNKYHYKRTIIGPPVQWRLSGVLIMAGLVAL